MNKNKFFRRFNSSIYIGYQKRFDSRIKNRSGWRFSTSFQTNDLWRYSISSRYVSKIKDWYETRTENRFILDPKSLSWSFGIDSDNTRKFSYGADYEFTNYKNHQFNFFTGNFDFSDDKQAAVLVGFQHQNESLKRDTIIGKISPITGGFITENSAVYIYTGFEWNVDMGALTFTPSFAPGLYYEGDGKDLGHVLEFKSEIQFSYELSNDTNIGLSYNHLSNASIGDKNPGANSYMFNFIKNF